MPNHVHGIIVLQETVGASLVGAQAEGNGPIGDNRATTRVAPRGLPLRWAWTPFRGRLWQRNDYEHIVRDDKSLGRIERYILDNPANWSLDQENPLNVPAASGLP